MQTQMKWYIKIVCKLILKWRKIKINDNGIKIIITYDFNIPIIVNDMGSHRVHTFNVPKLCSILA
jgi:hypothetical protein